MDIDKLKSLVSDMCINAGLNTSHDFDGVEDESDVFLYLKAINRMMKERSNAVKPVYANPETEAFKKEQLCLVECNTNIVLKDVIMLKGYSYYVYIGYNNDITIYNPIDNKAILSFIEMYWLDFMKHFNNIERISPMIKHG